MEQSKVLTALSALAHAARLNLVRLLMPLGDQGLPAGEIARSLGLTASCLSFHLAAMERAGLIRSRRVARNVIYTIDAGQIGQTLGYLLNHACCDHPTVRACCARHADVAPITVLPGP